MRSQRASLPSVSLLVFSLIAACSSPRSSGTTPIDTDASQDVGADLGADTPSVADAPADQGAVDAPDAPDAGGPDDVGTDAPADVPSTNDVPTDVPADVPADVPPLACRSDRDCSSRMQVCDTGRMLCVDCNTAGDCNGTEVCSGNHCVPAPPPCRSDIQCSARMQVCNTTRMLCVDCNTAVDCPANHVCSPDGTCAPQVCTPGAVTCADESTRRLCSSDGRMFTTAPCPAVTNGVSRCGDGVCTPSCNANFADCDGNVANGCEVDLRANLSNCGRCGNLCPSSGGFATCAAGVCSLTCSSSRGDCDGSSANGCETNLATSNAHCGRCGSACAAGLTCTDGVCLLSGCPSGQTLCGGACVDLNTNVAQCGACGRACSLPNATAACSAGTCVVARCATGLGDCDGVAANGCETDTTSTPASCGACGNACPAPQNSIAACVGSSCGIYCAAGFGSCDGSNVNGCEVSLNTTANCGACGRACATGQACQSGVCVTNSCPTGQTLCSGGVCRNLTNDVSNCGACGRVCAAGQTCTSSVCSSNTLRFTLSWNVTADYDIAVVTPSGVVIDYRARMGAGGTLDADSMTTGPEQIYWSTTPASGTYSVCAIPYRVSGATSYTLQVFRGGTLTTTRTGSASVSAASGAICSATSPYKVLDFVY